MSTPGSPAAPARADPWVVHRSVPFIYVADVERSLAFYALLGFEAREIMRDHPEPDPAAGAARPGRANWAWAQTPPGGSRGVAAQLMFSRTWRPIVPGHQDIFLYLYALDIVSLRDRLLAYGVRDGGGPAEWETPEGVPRATSTLFAIHHPPYMPAGEFRIHDPDGYCLLVGQLDEPGLG